MFSTLKIGNKNYRNDSPACGEFIQSGFVYMYVHVSVKEAVNYFTVNS